MGEPAGVSLDVDHRHCPAKLKLRDEVEQKGGSGPTAGRKVILLGLGIKREVAVRGNTSEVKAAFGIGRLVRCSAGRLRP
jgi:hypothetical protein